MTLNQMKTLKVGDKLRVIKPIYSYVGYVPIGHVVTVSKPREEWNNVCVGGWHTTAEKRRLATSVSGIGEYPYSLFADEIEKVEE